jgi:hypothetical protein
MGRLLKKKVAAFVIILVLALSIAAAFYVTAQDSFSNFLKTTTPQPTATPTSAQSTNQPQQTPKPQDTPTEPNTVTFDYSQTNIQYTDSTTIITLKIAFNAPSHYVISLYGFYLISNETKISDKTINRSGSGYPLTIDFIINGHYTDDYELRYKGSNATFLYNKV